MIIECTSELHPELPRDRRYLEEFDKDAYKLFLELFIRSVAILRGSGLLLSFSGQRGGRRSTKQQQSLYSKGRVQLADGRWIVSDRRQVVTWCDGIFEVSDHQLGFAGDLLLRRRLASGGVGPHAPWYDRKRRNDTDILFERIQAAAEPIGIDASLEWDPHHFSAVGRLLI